MTKLAMLVTLAISFAAPRADADCMYFGLTATPITAANTAIPPDGGVVIAALPDQKGKLDPGDAALKHPFVIKGVNKPLARSIAPGLAIVPIPPKTTALFDQAGTSVLALETSATKVAAPAAPKVKALEFEAMRSKHGQDRVFVTIENLPAGTLAVVLSDVQGKGKSWGRVTGDRTARIQGYGSGDCQALPNGTQPSKVGDKLIVRYIDALGRLSPPSAAIAVTGTAP